MICPACGAAIPADSFFCDQCGGEIRICPLCGKPGRRNWCIHDGEALVPARELARAETADTARTRDEQPHDTEPIERLRLRNDAHRLDLAIRPGTLVGRRSGVYAALFSSFPDISGIHARFDYSPLTGWTVTDLDSTNGSFCDGRRLPPHRPERLLNGTRLGFATLELRVFLTDGGTDADSGTVRLR